MSLLGIDKTPEEQAEIARVEKLANSIFIASIISILFCCLGGAVATYFAHQAKQDAASGEVDLAKRNINIAIGLMIASFVIGTLSILGRIVS
jgi:hypothetical protein